MTEVPDAELVRRCLDGRREAFAALIERHQEPVFNIAFRMTRSHADAADLAQEAFIRAYRKLARYKPEYPFRNWVMTICVNMTKNSFRSKVRRREAEATHQELRSHDASGVSASPAGTALGEALHKLSPKWRVPLVLKHVEGFSYEEIAQMLGLGLSAAKMRVQRGRNELIRLVRSTEGG